MTELTDYDKAARARTLKDEYMRDAQNLKIDLGNYMASFVTKYRLNKFEKSIMNNETSEETSEEICAANKLREKNALAKKRRENKKAYKKELESIEHWKSGAGSHMYLTFVTGVYLRVKDGYVETSQSARVPEREARILYNAHKAGKKVIGSKISDFTVLSVNGTVKIGCHEIDMKEVERIAKERNW